MPYTPTWTQQNAFPQYQGQTIPQAQNIYQPYQQQYQMQQQPVQQQFAQGQVKVDGPVEAMHRFLMQYPNQLMPGFISQPLFDVNGRQFHTLSVEADGRRNLETFDFEKHVERSDVQESGVNGSEYVSRMEFDQTISSLAKKISEVENGVHGPVQQPAYVERVPVTTVIDAAKSADATAAGSAGMREA